MKAKIRCPHLDCDYGARRRGHGTTRTYEDVVVGDEIRCSYCRQQFVVTKELIAYVVPDSAPLGEFDRDGVPLTVPYEERDSWRDANWPANWRESAR